MLVDGLVEIEPTDSEYFIEYDIITPSGIRPIEATFSETDSGMRLILMPDEPGQWKVIGRMIVSGLDDSLKSEVDFEVLPPDEGDTILSVEPIIEMDFSAPLTISGKVIHTTPHLVQSLMVQILNLQIMLESSILDKELSRNHTTSH